MPIPYSISILFVLITCTTIFLFWHASQYNKKALSFLIFILIVQGLLAYVNFYSTTPIHPAKVPLVVAPSFISLFVVLFSKRFEKFTASLNIKTLTLLHTIRIPVELILLALFTHNAIPEVMTFEGRNFDILAGITAPIIYYFTFVKKVIGPKGLLAWNIICLLLLINIIVHAVLSLPIPIQQFGLEQPNRAILYFPFIWLPVIVVPIVFFAHAVIIKKLLSRG